MSYVIGHIRELIVELRKNRVFRKADLFFHKASNFQIDPPQQNIQNCCFIVCYTIKKYLAILISVRISNLKLVQTKIP